jgi:membrane protein implicated in regulation of membrane protease activity
MSEQAPRRRREVPYLIKKRERTRTWVVFALLFILLLTIVGTFSLIWCGKDKAEMFTQTALPLITTLVGSALGFYFGGKGKEEEEKEIGGADSGATESIQKPPSS